MLQHICIIFFAQIRANDTQQTKITPNNRKTLKNDPKRAKRVKDKKKKRGGGKMTPKWA